MKTLLLFIASLFLFNLAYAQDATLPRVENDTLYTTSGYKIGEGQEVTIGRGSTPEGEYIYIKQRGTTLGYKLGPFSKENVGRSYIVTKLKQEGSEKKGFHYIILLKDAMTRWEVDVENAIKFGQLQVPAEYRPVTAIGDNSGTGLSTADELRKLKKLYDDGILTREEYEAQKKKLLDKK